MNKTRVFISFDYDNDADIKNLLVGQSRNEDSPFSIVDMSIKEPINYNWKENARKRIKSCDVVAVLCGEKTNTATGVSAEMRIAQEEHVPYFLLSGRPNGNVVRPLAAKNSDKLYKWSWDILKALIAGRR
jgi:hypothetical protein